MADDNDIRPMREGETPIDYLSPQSPQHDRVKKYLLDRIKYSADAMTKFHSRWRANELMLQAYVGLNDYDKLLKKMNDDKKGPGAPIEINVPYAWAVINTIVTYLLHTFGGRSPIFTVGSYRAEQVQRAKNMEMLLQYNADYMKFIRTLYFFLMDGETYGVSIIRTLWKQETKTRSILMPPDPMLVQVLGQFGQQAEPERRDETYVCFEGNSVTNIDPFMFFPDPRVPMHEVNEKGEFVFWRAFIGRHKLLKEQAAGRVKWIDKVDRDSMGGEQDETAGSLRGMRSLGDSHAGGDWRDRGRSGDVAPNYRIEQGTIEIVPKDLGLGDSDTPEKWMFSILNGQQIIQAIKVELPAGKHPIEVAEPNSVGYSFGQLGTGDMLGPMQGMMSWFLNSHIYNVRASLNNMFVVDPSRVEMQDFSNPEPGKLIRLKNTAFGLADPKSAVYQLAVTDITRSHITDFQMMERMASDLTGAVDNVRGLQDNGGRKTATEVRTSAEAGASRLASKGKVYSSMALTGLAEQWALNYQSYLTEEFELQVLGREGQQNSVRITPDSIQGDFYFPVHDGTLPIDKVGLLDVWRQIFQAVLADPELRQQYDLGSMFNWIAQLGGAQNIQSFKLNVVPTTQGLNAVGGGQGIPLNQAAQMMGAQSGR